MRSAPIVVSASMSIYAVEKIASATTSYDVVADAIFSTAYIDIEADTTMGALRIAATGVAGYDITWTANVQVKELP